MSVQSLFLRHGGSEERVSFAAVDAAPQGDFLSADEQAQFASFQFAAKKETFLLGRLAAKRALGALLQEPDLRRIEIRAGIYGQPLVQHPQTRGAQVSLSHSHGLAVALAFPAPYPMGIDLESIAAVSAETIIGEIGASPPELTWLATGGVDAATACCVLWTAREALGKSLQTGVNSPLGVFALGEIRAAADGSWVGQYLNFPRCQCLARVEGGRVVTVALPGEAALSAPLRLGPQG